MRLFFAASIPDDVRSALVGRLEAHPRIGGLRWTGAGQLHVTLRFLGEVPPDRLPVVEAAGSQAVAAPAFSIRIEGAGTFPDQRHPKVFWSAIAGDRDAIAAVAGALEQKLVEAGFPPDERGFTPHLTLGRARKDVHLTASAAQSFQDALGGYRSRSFDVKEIHLFSSHLGPVGPRYEILRTFPLA